MKTFVGGLGEAGRDVAACGGYPTTISAELR